MRTDNGDFIGFGGKKEFEAFIDKDGQGAFVISLPTIDDPSKLPPCSERRLCFVNMNVGGKTAQQIVDKLNELTKKTAAPRGEGRCRYPQSKGGVT